MKKSIRSNLFAILLPMVVALPVAGCGGGGSNDGGNQYTPICSFNNQKVTIYTDYPTIASFSQDSTGVITGTAYDNGFDQSINGVIQASAYSASFNLIEKGKIYSVSLTGTVVNSGGVCVSAKGDYTRKDGNTTVSSGKFNVLNENYAAALPTSDGKLNGYRMMDINGLASGKISINSASSASNLVFGKFESGANVAGWASGTNMKLTWMGTYSSQKAMFKFEGTDAEDGTATGTTTVLSYSNTNTVLASGLTSSISLLPPITLDGARVIKTITYAYMPLPPASNVQVHNVTFTTIDTAVTGTDAGGTTSTGAVVSGWGPITAGSINQTTGAVTFSFEAVVCSGGTSIITVSGNTDGTNGSGIVTFTAGPDSCEIPSGTWSMEDSLAPVSVAGNWLFDLYNGSSATASLLQTSGNPDLISSTTGTGTLPGFGSYPINVSGTLDNSVASPKPIILTFTTDLSTIGCGIITVTATGIATATSMSGTYDSVSSTHIGACESSNVSWSGTKL